MSRYLDYKDGNPIERIEDMNACKWLVDDVCCNGDSLWRADFPNGHCDYCKYFEKEDGKCIN